MTTPNPIQFLPVEKLLFDPENPRLPSSLNKKDETSVLRWMLDDATILELMMSIGEKDYFEGEPLLVVEDEFTLDQCFVRYFRCDRNANYSRYCYLRTQPESFGKLS